MLSWCSIISVKFGFLFLFKKLVARVPFMAMYWWIAAFLNLLISIYGFTVYLVACPYFHSERYCTSTMRCSFQQYAMANENKLAAALRESRICLYLV